MEEDRTALCGPKGMPQGQRSAVRGGTTPASVVLAGRRIAVQRQRVRDLLICNEVSWCCPLNCSAVAPTWRKAAPMLAISRLSTSARPCTASGTASSG